MHAPHSRACATLPHVAQREGARAASTTALPWPPLAAARQAASSTAGRMPRRASGSSTAASCASIIARRRRGSSCAQGADSGTPTTGCLARRKNAFMLAHVWRIPWRSQPLMQTCERDPARQLYMPGLPVCRRRGGKRARGADSGGPDDEPRKVARHTGDGPRTRGGGAWRSVGRHAAGAGGGGWEPGRAMRSAKRARSGRDAPADGSADSVCARNLCMKTSACLTRLYQRCLGLP